MTEQAPAHQVLARRYRPQRFSEVVEQKMPVAALKNAIRSNRLGSAYLFFGPHGVGKTTIARILARRVNCLNPEEEEPCNNCESCRSILEGNSLDVLEIDGASNRGIDPIRELRENVKFPPMVSQKKVYIIDEVHMLTNEASNALLKTVEEPPPHVLFIFATTEMNKIPATILSRCQVFHFRKVQLSIIQTYMAELLKRDGIAFDDEALFWIARRGDGSVRDSLSALEQAMIFCDGKIETEKVKKLIGLIPYDLFAGITKALLDASTSREELLRPIQEAFASGLDLTSFVWEYLDFLRLLTHISAGIRDPEFLGIPESEIARIKSEFGEMEPAHLDLIFESIYALLARSLELKLQSAYEKRVLLEIELLSLQERLRRPSLAGVLKKLNRLGAAIESGKPYVPEHEVQKEFLGTIVDPAEVPKL